jgi:aspartyl-tRNA(Asn)/glutamyl-tRNA(Gln) amidotransferase subunit A
MIDIKNLTIKKAHDDMKNGKYSSVDLTKAYIEEITKKNKDINAYLEVFSDSLEQAKSADERFKSGTDTLLTGIPFAIKDNILIQGRIASSASKILENYHSTYDATVISKSL